jgi:outer membrane protein OmpA-like peptidoglycan-associated protein
MNMKNIKPLFIAFVLICTSAIGQTARQKRAEGLYNNFSFVKAIEHYEKLIEKNDNKDYALRKLGDTYIMLRMPEEALSIYKQVVQQPNVPSEYYYYYAQVLRATGDYKESKIWMKKYREAGNKTDSRVKEFFKDGDLASGIFNSYERYSLSKLDINTEFNDFGALEFGDEIYFTSSRDIGVSVDRIYAWDEQPFLDIFKTSKEGASVSTTMRIEGDVNTNKFHDGPVTFSADGTKMYFSRNNSIGNKKIKDSKGTGQVAIYSADLVDGIWSNVKEISLSNSEYLVYNPSLSHDGTKLYFASDMPGGFGGTDIYVSNIDDNGSFGMPKNLGEIVNSEGNESFPFIHKDGVLYFSSDGHVGMGLLDVFATVTGSEGEIVNVINLGDPINSKKDDFTYTLSEDGFSGYVASNRKGGVGNDDIYSFNRIPPLRLKGQIFDAINNEPIAGAKVVLGRKNGEEIAYFITGEDGSYEHLIERDADFVLSGSKDKYDNISKDFNSFDLEKQKELIVDLNIGMAPIEDVVLLADLETIYFDLDKSNIRPDAALELDKVVNLMNKYPGMVIRLESHTDSRATKDYNLALSSLRAISTFEYIVSQGISSDRITKFEGFGESQLVNRCSDNVKCSDEEHQLNRRTEFVILKMK